jgi:hypothetical protein
MIPGADYKAVAARTGKRLAWLRGPSIGEAFRESGRSVKEVKEKAGKDLTKYIDAQVKLLLGRAG